MTDYAVYDTGTGEILSVGRSSASITDIDAAITDGVVEGVADKDSDYVSGGVITARPTASTSIDVTDIQADGFDAATITGVPTGWTYTTSAGQTGTTDGTSITVTAIEPGILTILFTNWPYQDIEYTINATSAP